MLRIRTMIACLISFSCILIGACGGGGSNKIKIDRTDLADVGTGS